MFEGLLDMADVVFSVELETSIVGAGEPSFFRLRITHDDVGLAALLDWFSVWDLICHI